MDATIEVTKPRVDATRTSALVFPDLALPMIRCERPEDGPFINPILDAAFGPGRFAKVSERVREAARLNRALSQVAVRDGEVVGCCRLYDIRIGDAPVLFLGPLAVHPRVQAGGLGQALVRAALTAAGADATILVVGQPSLFARFGFVQTPDGAVQMPGPTEARRLQWRLGNTASAPSGRVLAPIGLRDAN